MTGPEHYQAAEHYAHEADAWMDKDWGHYATIGVHERIERRMADLAAAQVHATLALGAAVAAARLGEIPEWDLATGRTP
jgi:hypothetical protein